MLRIHQSIISKYNNNSEPELFIPGLVRTTFMVKK